ncbi:MAG: MHYT domain-containing protein, partial [Octadecabacter sp.]
MLYIISCITVQHDLWLVLLAGVICAFGCWVTSRLSKHSQNRTGSRSTPWAILTAVIAGVTIWCTHFIAMLGYQPAVPVSFDLMLTALSLFIAVVGSIVGILFANAVKLKAAPVIGGAILGLTISAMHYTGMIAYRVTGLVFWNEGYLITSIVLAIVLSAAALHLGHQKIRGSEIYMTVALTLAIVCLHFIGMVAFNVSV